MKVGFIRCMQTEDFCPGGVDFKTVAKDLGEDIRILDYSHNA